MSGGVLLAAGGTGGHMVPADAVAGVLARRGHAVALLTDVRGSRFPGLFAGVETHVIAAATLGGNPLRWPGAVARILAGRRAGARIVAAKRARAVVGFGGYPALPAMLAGRAAGVATLLHEQNAVLGRVNRLLAKRVSVLALAHAGTARVPAGTRVVVTGNPVREAVLRARDLPFRAPGAGEMFRLLVVGGSQGARILSDVVPAAVGLLDAGARRRLAVVHQARAEDVARAQAAYAAAGVAAECVAYLADLPERMAAAHLVVGRAGASTMAELTAMGRPAVLVPFQAATDDHQWANAAGFEAAGAGRVYRESAFTADALAGALAGFLQAPERLAAAAAAARGLGVPDAAERLADLVEAEIAAAAPGARAA